MSHVESRIVPEARGIDASLKAGLLVRFRRGRLRYSHRVAPPGLRTALLLIAWTIVSGCSKGTAASNDDKVAPATRPSKESTAIVEPSDQRKRPVLLRIPEPISNVRLTRDLAGTRAGTLDGNSFARLLRRADPVPPDDPSISRWAYAPWYAGSFAGPHGVYTFELYLGGRGKLHTPDGEFGYFSFNYGPSTRLGNEEPKSSPNRGL
jgi:hypothetical protein